MLGNKYVVLVLLQSCRTLAELQELRKFKQQEPDKRLKNLQVAAMLMLTGLSQWLLSYQLLP